MNLELDTIAAEEGPGLGAAMLAAVACNEYASVADVAARIVRANGTVKPNPEIAARYEGRYREFRRIYPFVKELFPLMC